MTPVPTSTRPKTSIDDSKTARWQTKTRTSIHHLRYFHDLTGRRIKKAMNTMKFIETHINMLMDISGGVDAMKAHAPPIIIDTREGESVS